jgi:hypothetical protein
VRWQLIAQILVMIVKHYYYQLLIKNARFSGLDKVKNREDECQNRRLNDVFFRFLYGNIESFVW